MSGERESKFYKDHDRKRARSLASSPVRVMPHSTTLEVSILGGIIMRNEALAYVPTLEVEHFYELRHKVVFQAIRSLEARGMPIDIPTLHNEISRAGKIDAVGGEPYLQEIALRVATVDNVEAYAQEVVRHSITRSVMLTLADFIEEGYAEESGGEDLMHAVTSALMTIRTGSESPIVTMSSLIADEAQRVLSDMEKRAAGEFTYAGIPTGINMIDERVGGHPRQLLTLYIGRPGMGKTTITMQVGQASSYVADEDSLIASYEDGGQSFGQRGLAQETGISTELIRARKLSPEDIIEIAGKWQATNRKELLLNAAGMEVEALARRIRRENIRRRSVGQKPLAQVIVDYIQKMPMPEWARSRDEGVSHISRVLTTIAVKENLAMVGMCQLNREVEKRDDHQPRLSDIRDSGSLEQDGKLIFGCYHPQTYNNDKHPEEEFHLLVLKNHQGQNYGDIQLWWDRKRHAIYNSQLDYQRARVARGGY